MHEKPTMVVDETNRKIRETPIRSAEEEEVASGGDYNLHEPELTQRQVTSPLVAPENVLASDNYIALGAAAHDYLHRMEAGHMPASGARRGEAYVDEGISATRAHGGRLEHDDNHKLPQSKIEHRPTPRNKPMIQDVPVIAELVSGKLPMDLSRQTSGETTITGIIEHIDRKTGHITLDAGTALELCFPLGAVQDLLAKDSITVRVRYRDTAL